MRSFEERRAEIFRRSDERLKRIKRRRSATLLSLLPLVIFVAVYGVLIFPAMLPAGSEDMSNGASPTLEIIYSVDDTEKSETIVDEVKVYEVYNYISVYFVDIGGEGPTDGPGSPGDGFCGDPDDGDSGVIFEFSFGTADVRTYRLIGRILIEESSGCFVLIDEEQLEGLFLILEN